MKSHILLLLLILPVLLFLCALSLMWIPLPQPFPPSMSGERNQIAAIMTGIVSFIFIIGLGIYTTSMFLKAARFLDASLEKAGLHSISHLVFGRKYQGTIAGRKIKVDFMPPQKIRPALLNVHIEAPLGMRAAIGRTRPLLDCRDCPRLEGIWPELSDLKIYAHEKEKTCRLLANPKTREILARLLGDQIKFGFREIYIQPEKIWLRAHPRQMTEKVFQKWFEDMLALTLTSRET